MKWTSFQWMVVAMGASIASNTADGWFLPLIWSLMAILSFVAGFIRVMAERE
jgi:hypothetical protein